MVMSQTSNFDICVIGHEKRGHHLPDGFRYLTREVDYELRQKIDVTYIFKSSGLAWSEYAAIFENYKFSPNAAGVVGLYQYRCVLNLTNTRFKTVPFFLRNRILSSHAHKLSDMRERIIVGTPVEFPESLLANFGYAHPDFILILEVGAQIYDELNGNVSGFAISYLASNNKLVTRNLFIAPKEFSDRWVRMAFEIARQLDERFPEPKPDRWGGFVLERLFSIYIEQEINRGEYRVEFYPHLYFASTRTLIKIPATSAKSGLLKLRKKIMKFF